jgi:hypothetical protein
MRTLLLAVLIGLGLAASAPVAQAQGPGGLYVAGIDFTFANAVKQGLADNRKPGRFIVLVVPPATRALLAEGAPPADVQLRKTAAARGGQFVVCRRDVESGAVLPANLVPGVGVVWGWTKNPNAPQMGPNGLFPDESPAYFPYDANLIRRMRSICAS